MADAERLSLLHKVAHLHHEMGLKKYAIAQKIKQSPTQVGLLLKEAQTKGIIDITVRLPQLFGLQESLKSRFGLLDAVVVPHDSDAHLVRLNLSRATASYFDRNVTAGKKIAVGGGYLTYRMVDMLASSERDIEIFPTAIVGRGSVLSHIDPSIVATVLWAKCGHRLGQLHLYSITPPETGTSFPKIQAHYAEILRKNKTLRAVCDGIQNVDMVFASVGAIRLDEPYLRTRQKNSSALVEELSLDADELRNDGAIGDIAYSFIDSHGKSRPEWSIFPGLEIKGLKALAANQTKRVVITVGSYKMEPLRAILSGRLCNVLITDVSAAEQLLRAVG